ncbi:MAG: hypothetical protein KatS3mg060_1634 [Dehalococcoidia bacterium]|nr:MAG: hypothetical protein KatS3mg060_1634 [Dehalococcoidia bacterium]
MTERTGLRVRRLGARLLALDDVDLGHNPGSALRGALAAALRDRRCDDDATWNSSHRRHCPACLFLAGADPAWPRGRDLPRPYTIEPVTPRVAAGEQWSFSLTLIGPAIELNEAVIDAVELAAARGIGRGRGRSVLLEAVWLSPIDDLGASVADDERITASTEPVETLTIAFRTPLRLTHRGKLVRSPNLEVLVQRLLERLEALSLLYGDDPPPPAVWRARRAAVQPVAQGAVLEHDATRWHDAWSGSRRSGTITPTGGIVGEARWRGDLTALIPWLRWGAAVHVGKNAVKGDGWIALSAVSASPPSRRGE